MNKNYIDFIRYAIHPEMDIPTGSERMDWADFMEFSNRQGVVGLVYGGLERSGMRIPQMTLFEWIGFAEKIKAQNKVVNKRIVQVAKIFDEKGCGYVMMKGQANSLMYPRPELRSPGDIDVWVTTDISGRKYGSLDETAQIINMILKECPDAHYSINHVKMPVFDDVSVEVHYSPSHLINWFKDLKLQRYIQTVVEKEFRHKVRIDGYEVGAMTDYFNIIYQLLHMYGHFFTTRNNFKQFVDYYFLLKKGHTDFTDFTDKLREFGLLRYAEGMMWVMKEVLGLEEKYLYVKPDEKVGRIILSESMRFGTFAENKLKQVIQQFAGNLRLVRYFPSEVLISPLFLIWHQWWKIKVKLFI